MKNKDYIMKVYEELGAEKGTIILEMHIMQIISEHIENITDNRLRDSLKQTFEKIGEEFGNCDALNVGDGKWKIGKN